MRSFTKEQNRLKTEEKESPVIIEAEIIIILYKSYVENR